MTPLLGIIADDFTGALMVASYIEGAGIHCPVVFDVASAVPNAPIVIVGTRVRTIPASEARIILAHAADALAAAGCEQLAYKACASFDSTAEGNIGLAADFLADRQGIRPVLMSAGFPRFDITVHQGYMFYRGRLVSESIKRFDPLTPMSDPDLVRFLSLQTPHQVGLIPHSTLLKGPVAARQAFDGFTAKGAGHVLLDMTDDGDVEVAADLASSTQRIIVASDPLIIAYACRLAETRRTEPQPLPRHVGGPAAVIAGTVGPVILRQLDVFRNTHPVLVLDLLDPRGEAAVIAAALDWATALIGTQPFAITTATDTEGVERAQQALGQRGAARRAEHMLGEISRQLFDRGVSRFVVAGGETSGAVVAALGIGAVRALPDEPFGSGFCVAEGRRPISLYLKPGKLGADDVLLRALEIMNP